MSKKLRLVGLLLCVVFAIALFGAVGCGGEGTGESKGEVVIASKQFAENLILSHMAAILIEEKTDYKANISKIGMGATELLHPALAEGEIDLYPEYTNTAWMVVLQEGDPIYDRQECYETVKKAYQEQFDLTCLEPFGFDNTFVVAVLTDLAEELNLKTIGDLSSHPELSFIGDSTTFTRPDVYLGLQETYGLDLKQVVVDTTFFYEAIAQKEGDVIAYFATDGQSREYDLFILEDDKHFFPPYDGMFVIRNEVLEKCPEIEDALKPLSGTINDDVMVNLNYKVEVENQDAADVAKEYLKSKGLI